MRRRISGCACLKGVFGRKGEASHFLIVSCGWVVGEEIELNARALFLDVCWALRCSYLRS